MSSTPDTKNIGIELQAAGENLNTWGDPKLNNALRVLSNLASKFHSIAITGNYTVSETNYSTSNDTEVALIKVIGALTAAANFTIPGRQKRFIFWNGTTGGYSVTVKLAATTGVVVPMNGIAILATDGTTDVENVGPTHAGTSTQATDTNAYALWGAVQTAIAGASGLTAPFILVSGTDTTPGYLGQKLASAKANAAWSTQNSGANEAALLTINELALIDGGTITGAQAVAVNSKYLCDFTGSSYTITLPAAPSAGDTILLTKFGANTMTLGLNSLKFKGSTTNPTSTQEGQSLIRYTGASRGWVEL